MRTFLYEPLSELILRRFDGPGSSWTVDFTLNPGVLFCTASAPPPGTEAVTLGRSVDAVNCRPNGVDSPTVSSCFSTHSMKQP